MRVHANMFTEEAPVAYEFMPRRSGRVRKSVRVPNRGSHRLSGSSTRLSDLSGTRDTQIQVDKWRMGIVLSLSISLIAILIYYTSYPLVCLLQHSIINLT